VVGSDMFKLELLGPCLLAAQTHACETDSPIARKLCPHNLEANRRPFVNSSLGLSTLFASSSLDAGSDVLVPNRPQDLFRENQNYCPMGGPVSLQ
jgi:hypothetical protein